MRGRKGELVNDLISRSRLLNEMSDWQYGEAPFLTPDVALEYTAKEMQTMIYRTIKDAMLCVADQPAVDAVPIVRCNDCKWFDPKHPCGTIEPLAFKCRRYGTFHIPGFFCGDGERRKSWEDPSHPCADSVMMGG